MLTNVQPIFLPFILKTVNNVNTLTKQFCQDCAPCKHNLLH